MLALPKFKVHEVATESEISAARDRLDWPHQLLSVPSVWSKVQGSGITVAVLDTGAALVECGGGGKNTHINTR